MNQVGIRQLIPIREPALHVDRVVSLDEETVVAEKVISIAESCYPLPGSEETYDYPFALLVESMAQTAVILAASREPGDDVIPVIASIAKARSLKPVLPGATVQHRVRRASNVGGASIFSCESWVADELVADAQRIVIALTPGERYR